MVWGTGGCFAQNLSLVEERCEVRYACDNNSSKWDKEIVSGVTCISPESLKSMGEIKDIFVIMMLENSNIMMRIANQLLDMGIDNFDSVYNWLKYNND